MINNDLFLSYSKECENLPIEDSINQKTEQSLPGYRFNEWPTLIDLNTKDHYSKVSVEIFNLIKRIPEIFNYDNNKIQEYYQIPLSDVEDALNDLNKNNINHIIGRGDFIVDKDNEIQCIEFNIGCMLGGWYVDFIEELHLENSFISGFLESHKFEVVPNKFFYTFFDFLSSIKSNALEHEQSNCSNIAFVHPPYDQNSQKNVQKIKEIHREWSRENNQKGSLIFCTFDEIKYENGWYRYNDTIIHSILDLQDQNAGGFDSNKVSIVCAPIKHVIANKLNLVILSENQDSSLFTIAEKEIIKRNIPWTRKLNDDQVDFHGQTIKTIDYVLENKDKFVIKPVFGLAGQKVCIGSKVSESEWRKNISFCDENEPFVVQEYIKPQVNVYHSKTSGYYYCETVLGLFVFGNLYGGGFARNLSVDSKEGVINCAQGAEVGVLFVVK